MCRCQLSQTVIFSHAAVNAVFSAFGVNVCCAICGVNALFSFGAMNSFGSFLSINSAFSILSVNSFMSVGCNGSAFKVCIPNFTAGVIVLTVLFALLMLGSMIALGLKLKKDLEVGAGCATNCDQPDSVGQPVESQGTTSHGNASLCEPEPAKEV